MNQRQLASVLFVAVGLLIAAPQVAELFPFASMLATWNAADQGGFSRMNAVMTLVGSSVVVLLGVALIIFRDRLARRLFADPAQPMGVAGSQAVAFSVVGCYFTIRGFSLVVPSFASGRRLDWSGAMQLVLGLALFFGARGLGGVWSRLRMAPTSEPPGHAPSN